MYLQPYEVVFHKKVVYKTYTRFKCIVCKKWCNSFISSIVVTVLTQTRVILFTKNKTDDKIDLLKIDKIATLATMS